MSRHITIKQLYKTLSKELTDLPFSITKNGEVIAIVSRPKGNMSRPIDDKASRPDVLSRPLDAQKSRPADKVRQDTIPKLKEQMAAMQDDQAWRSQVKAMPKKGKK